jgi:hypothetical protein
MKQVRCVLPYPERVEAFPGGPAAQGPEGGPGPGSRAGGRRADPELGLGPAAGPPRAMAAFSLARAMSRAPGTSTTRLRIGGIPWVRGWR